MPECQQDAVYAAERSIEPGEVMSLPQAQAWLDELAQQPWFGEWYPMIAFIEVFKLPMTARRSVGAFIPEQGTGYAHLEMLPQHLTQLTLMHELAHACAAARYQSASHDPWFARVYLELVYCAIGWERYRCLRAAFEDHGVDFNVDTTRGSVIAL